MNDKPKKLEMSGTPIPAPDVDLDMISKQEMLDLCRKFAATMMSMQSSLESTLTMSNEDRGKQIVLWFPLVQGTRNQIALRRFGNSPTSDGNVQSAFNKLVHGQYDKATK